MRRGQAEPLVALLALIAVLTALAATVGLEVRGWVVAPRRAGPSALRCWRWLSPAPGAAVSLPPTGSPWRAACSWAA